MSNAQAKKATRIREIKALSKDIGIDLPLVTKKPIGKSNQSQIIRVIKFALEHGFVVTPAGIQYWIDSYNMFNYCPCDPARKTCPCPEAIDEVKKKGKCLCHLFWRDYTAYLEGKLRVNEEK